MKKLIFSFFFGLFLLTSSQQVFVNRRVRPEICFDIESVISINNSIGNSFLSLDQNESHSKIQIANGLRAKLPLLTNYSITEWEQPRKIRERLSDFRTESNGWRIRYRSVT